MDGPLDLRFDQDHGLSAWDWLQTCTREKLIQIIVDYGGENIQASRRIADAILMAREGLWPGGLPKRTREFAALVVAAKGKEYQAMHSAKMTFQALRIHINREFDELKRGLVSALKVMREGGKVGIITWKHSECNIVVDYFRWLENARQENPLLSWYQSAQKALKNNDESLLPECITFKNDDSVSSNTGELKAPEKHFVPKLQGETLLLANGAKEIMQSRKIPKACTFSSFILMFFFRTKFCT